MKYYTYKSQALRNICWLVTGLAVMAAVCCCWTVMPLAVKIPGCICAINLVLINGKREVIYYSYVRTLGKPLDIVRGELQKLKNAVPGLTDFKISVTGSGREYIGKETGADLIINEITAQTEGALTTHPETDTVFEIGGQDSKYMSCRNGKMTDFEMNKVCAAGTGAFLEEQIHKLGISLSEYD